jgi:hypothetical protein
LQVIIRHGIRGHLVAALRPKWQGVPALRHAARKPGPPTESHSAALTSSVSEY